VFDTLGKQALDHGDATAVLSVGGKTAFTFAQLWNRNADVNVWLKQAGFQRGERIGIAFDPGPEGAVNLLALCTFLRVAPIDNALPAKAMGRLCNQMKLDGLLLDRATRPRWHDLQKSGSCPVRLLDFARTSQTGRTHAIADFPEPADACLLMQTSGTSGTPKTVALTSGNLQYAAFRAIETLQLGPRDRLLTTMPLHHIHGFT